MNFLVFFSKPLISHIVSWSFTTNENLVVFHFNSCIVTCGEYKTTCLSIHSLRSKCSCNQEYFSSCQWFIESFVQLSNSDFDEGVLIRNYSFSFSSVVISTHLLIFRWINRRSLTKFDESFFLKYSELPSNERIVVRIKISGNKWSAMITM